MDKNTQIECYIQSHIGGRNENQDSAGYLEAPIGAVVVVCDGMGALNGGSTASRIAVKTIIDEVADADADAVPADVLKSAILHANDAIMDAAEEDSDLLGMGTTVTAIIINDDCATVSYLGDSRVYQLRGRNKVFRTFDHSFVFQSVKVGLITEEQARLSSQSNVITKALGIKREVEVDVYELPYLSGDRFVLCTDGFWGAMPETELLSLISKGNVSTVLEKATLQIDLTGIRRGGHHDNLTAAMFEVTKDSIRKTKMNTKIKLLIASLALALVMSLSFNVYQCINCRETQSAIGVPAETATSDDGEQTNNKQQETDERNTASEQSDSENVDDDSYSEDDK